jgi:hypothetical protein
LITGNRKDTLGIYACFGETILTERPASRRYMKEADEKEEK